MQRFSGSIAVALVTMLTAAAPAQRTNGSLADRIGALREGWSYASDESSAPQQRAAATATDRASSTGVATATDKSASLPGVDPRELLPRRWFGAVATDEPAVKKPQPTTKPHAGASTGSSRARMLRELRNATSAEASDPTPRPGATAVANRTSNDALAARPPTARAGSVFSPGATSGQAGHAPTRASAAIARSIAADVAGSLVAEIDASEDASLFDDEAFEDNAFDGGSYETAGQGAEVLSEAPTPTESAEPAVDESVAPEPLVAHAALPEADEPAVEQETIAEETAETDSARLSVAAEPAATRLPLYIGNRYAEQGSTVSTSDEMPMEDATLAQATPSKQNKAAETDDDALLMTQPMPVLVSRVSGPRTIVVGREVDYRVLLANRGEATAERLVTSVTVPEWAEVVSAESAAGLVDLEAFNDGELVWRMDRLANGDVAKLNVKLIARSGKPIELGVSWKHKQVDASTTVEVQEPMLALDMAGPDEVLFGKPQLFRLTLSNPGTGSAEGVTLHLTPPGGDTGRRTSHDFGTLAAGESRSVEIELTAREAGRLAVLASATATGDVSAEITKDLFCRKPELAVDWRGPKDRYAGSPAVYYFRVRNPGTAEANDVSLTVNLPAGFEVLPADGMPSPIGGRLTFRVGSLRPGDDRYFELRGVLSQAGANELAISAEAADDTRSEMITAVTEVVALADLKLDVLDPQGPIATGEELTYQIRVTNRGANEAHEVRVLGLFSAGIEPHHAEGGPSSINDGRIAFETIETLPAGAERVFKIHARAHEPGTHLFRAEVLCRDLEIKLAAEETTRFFEDESINVASESMSSGGGSGYVYPR